MERIAGLLGTGSPRTGAGAWGDDAAVFDAPTGRVLLCVDAGVAGVHLDTALFPIGDLGYRSAVAALSDLAAMGAAPLGVVVSICAPGDVDVVEVEAGVIGACAAHGCAVAGGDLSRSETTVVSVSALGVERGVPSVRRAGARPGDAILVTGPLGAAAAGLRLRRGGAQLDDPSVLAHRRPVARLAEGATAAASGATAMIDVSDGLARDVRRLAAASSVGAALHDAPLAPGATLAECLGGGEDYELVVTHPSPERLAAAFAGAGLRAPLRIGTVLEDAETLELDGEPLEDVGWRHGGAEAHEPE